MARRRLIDRILDKWPAKVLALAAAMLLFFFNRVSLLQERYVAVQLTLIENDSLCPAASYARTVRVRVKGEALGISTIGENDIDAVADISSFKAEGVYLVPVLISKIGQAVNSSIEVYSDPQEISFTLERRITKNVSITVDQRGYPEPGYYMKSMKIDPETIEISGPRSLVERSKSISTEALEMSGRTSDFSVSLKLRNDDKLITILGPSAVTLSTEIAVSSSIRLFEGVQVSLASIPKGLRFVGDAPTARLRAQGAQLELDAFVPGSDFIEADFSGIFGPGTYSIPLKTKLPPEFTLVQIDPATVTVELVPASSGQGGGN